MTHVSRKQLEDKALNRIHRTFVDSTTSMRSGVSAEAFFKELLSEAELLMISKRLAAICMLSEHISSYRIAKTLHLSSSTVLRLRHENERGRYAHIIKTYRKSRNDWWDDFEVLLRLGMPPRGKGRWEWLDKLNAKHP